MRKRKENSMFDLTGKTALVTGATGGIGGAIASALHKQGATVAISGTRREVLDAFAARLGERVHVLPCNLSKSDEVEALVPAAEAAMGEEVVEIGGLVADQMREHFALVPARQIGTGRGRRQVELRCVTRMLGHVTLSGLRSSQCPASRRGGQPSIG